MNVIPAMVTVPARAVVKVLAVALRVTVPLPLPLAPALTVIHVALLVAPQLHPAPATTLTVALPAAAAMLALEGLIEGAQGAVNENVFEGRLADDPPGPFALTRPS